MSLPHRKAFVLPALCFTNRMRSPGAACGLIHPFGQWMLPGNTWGPSLSRDGHPFVCAVRAAAAAPSSRAALD